MKTLRIFLISTILLISSHHMDFVNAEKTANYLISTQEALQSFIQYLNKQLNKYKISLVQEQIDSLIAKSRKLIYENAHDGKINQIIERKIEKDFKMYLKNTYPDKFKIKQPENEVYYKQAKNRIKAIVKDFIINKQQVKDPSQVRETWNQVKKSAYEKISKASYLNSNHDLVIDESVIPEISSKLFAKLETNKTKTDGGNPARKRKALFPETITLLKAEKIVRSMIRKKNINVKYCDSLTTTIMQKLGPKADERGRIETNVVIEITTQEIENFKKLKENLIKPEVEGGALDTFIQRFKKQFSDPDSLKIEF